MLGKRSTTWTTSLALFQPLKMKDLPLFFIVVLGLHCDIHKSSYNILNIAFIGKAKFDCVEETKCS
jgi:hypothetical protein